MHGPKIPNRPDPCEGESWPGYLLRLANENGLRGLVSIASLLEMTAERLLREDVGEIGRRLRLPYLAEREVNGQAYRGHLNMRTRVCPECLQADKKPHIRAAWDSPVILICELHRKILLDSCTSCKQPLTYRRGWVSQCCCGAQLVGWRSTRYDAWMRDMYELVQVPQVIDRPRPTFSPTWDEELQLAGLLLRMARAQQNSGHPGTEMRGTQHKFVERADLDACKEIFWQVPESVHACFSRWLASGVKLDQIRIPVGSKLHKIWLQIGRDLKLSKAALRAPPYQPPAGFVSKRRLMNETGLHATAIDYLIEAGLLKGTVKVAGTSVFTSRLLIPEAEFQGLLALHKGTMSIHEASEFALVRPSTIRILGYSGAVQTFRLGKCRYVFRLKSTDLSSVVQRVHSKARRFNGSFDCLVPLEDALTELYRFELALPKTLLDDIYAGRIQVLVINRFALHLGECYLDSRKFNEWCRVSKPVGARRVNKIPC
ncbi:MAG: TniQ family protein [Thiobacillus sp.]|nr:TniQ family protein [Thiobacillus sp.]